jgi:hypothetical protein
MKSLILLGSLLGVFGLQGGEPSIETLRITRNCCSGLGCRAFIVSAAVPPLVVCDVLCPETPFLAIGIGAAIGVGAVACNKTADWLDQKIQARIEQEKIIKQNKMK